MILGEGVKQKWKKDHKDNRDKTLYASMKLSMNFQKRVLPSKHK